MIFTKVSLFLSLGLLFVIPTWILSSDLDLTVSSELSDAKAKNGDYISWREHIIDDPIVGPSDLSGSDGLTMADLDKDGYEDIVSVHELDTVYGVPAGYVRIAWGSNDPEKWTLTTLASGHEAASAEDVSVADANGDGWLDIIVACELAHLIYFQNPTNNHRNQRWRRVIPKITENRGSFIRVFFGDFDKDGKPEVVAANKGAENPSLDDAPLNNVSIFLLPENPLNGNLWKERVLTQVKIPINSQPIDLDRDGDLDIVVGSRSEGRILWLENLGNLNFEEHPIELLGELPDGAWLTGFNMDYADMNNDGRLDIVSTVWPSYLAWLKQPKNPIEGWEMFVVGDMLPDQLVSVSLEDIDSDGDLDAFSGSYSRGSRDQDGPGVSVDDPLGRITWFENVENSLLWKRHDITRRKRGMYDKWISRDLDFDGDPDFIGTRGNSEPYDGVIWLEQIRSKKRLKNFIQAREKDSKHMPLP